MLPRYFAPIWSVRQEENGGKAIWSFIVGTDPDIGVRPAGKRESARAGTMFAGLRKAEELIALVVTLLSYGCPRQAIVHAFDLDERTTSPMARTSWAAVPKGS